MLSVALICLLIMMYFDISLFKKQNKWLFHEIFFVPPQAFYVFSFLILIIFSISNDNGDRSIPFFILFFFPPFYINKRIQFVKSNQKTVSLTQPDQFRMALSSDAVGVIIGWFSGIVMLAILIKAYVFFWPQLESKLTEIIITAILPSCLMLFLIYQASQKFSKNGFLFNMALHFKGRSNFKVVLVPILMGLFFATLSATIVLTRQEQPLTPLAEIIQSTQSPALLIGFLVLAIFIAPLIEEIIFRGYFFHVLSRVKGQRFAIYCIAFIFAFLHVGQYWGDWMAIGMVALLGLTLTYLRAWSESTLSSVIMHYVYNLGVTVIPFIIILNAS